MSGVQDSRRSLCVYTVKLGNYDSLLEQPLAAQSAADFICFTDDATLESDTWEIRLIEPLLPADLPRSSRHPKICAHEYLPNYELSIYIDASIELSAPPERLIEELFDPAASDMVCLQHSNRDTLVDELLAIVKWGLDDPARCVEQVNHYYLSPHYPTGPLIWGGLLIRRHNSATVIQVMERWFSHVLRYSRRDQLSFGYVAKSLGFDYRALPLSNADSGYHVWPRGRSRHRVDRSVSAEILPLALSTPYGQVQQVRPDATATPPPAVPLPDGVGGHRERMAKELLGLRRRLLPPRPRRHRTRGAPARRGRVVFMLDSLDDRSASMTIYARQLRDIADTKAESVGYDTFLSDDLSHRGSILILSKQFLKLRPVEHLWKLRAEATS